MRIVHHYIKKYLKYLFINLKLLEKPSIIQWCAGINILKFTLHYFYFSWDFFFFNQIQKVHHNEPLNFKQHSEMRQTGDISPMPKIVSLSERLLIGKWLLKEETFFKFIWFKVVWFFTHFHSSFFKYEYIYLPVGSR